MEYGTRVLQYNATCSRADNHGPQRSAASHVTVANKTLTTAVDHSRAAGCFRRPWFGWARCMRSRKFLPGGHRVDTEDRLQVHSDGVQKVDGVEYKHDDCVRVHLVRTHHGFYIANFLVREPYCVATLAEIPVEQLAHQRVGLDVPQRVGDEEKDQCQLRVLDTRAVGGKSLGGRATKYRRARCLRFEATRCRRSRRGDTIASVRRSRRNEGWVAIRVHVGVQGRVGAPLPP